MPTTYKILGQLNTASTALQTLYTVPASASAVCSTLSVANLSTASSTYRIAIRPAAETAVSNKNYLAFDAPLLANDSVMLTLGISLSQSDVVSVSPGNTNATISFSLFGTEIT